MTEKEKFLKLESYEEFDQRRDEFKALKFDKDIISHMSKLFGKSPNPPEELYRTPQLKQCRKCLNWKEFNGCSLYPQVLKEFPVKDGKEILCEYLEKEKRI